MESPVGFGAEANLRFRSSPSTSVGGNIDPATGATQAPNHETAPGRVASGQNQRDGGTGAFYGVRFLETAFGEGS